jgi:CHAT domain-containing protein
MKYLSILILILFSHIAVAQGGLFDKIIKTATKGQEVINSFKSKPVDKPAEKTVEKPMDRLTDKPSEKSTAANEKSIPVDNNAKKFGLRDIHEYAQTGNNQLLLRECLEKGIYVDIPTQRSTGEYFQTKSDLTALMIAVQYEKIETCKLLLLYGADPTIKNADNISAFDIALSTNSQSILRVLKKKEIPLPVQNGQQLLIKAQESFKIGEYVIANAFGCAAFNTFNRDVTKKNSYEMMSTISLLADSYDKMAIFPKAEFYYSQLININENAFGNQSADYVYSLLKLTNYYTRIAQFDRASLLLDILNDWSVKNPTKDKMAHIKIMDSMALLLIAQRKNSTPWLVKALNAKKKLVGEQHYEYALTLLNIFKGRKNNLIEKATSNNIKEVIGGAMSEVIKKQYSGILDYADSDEGKKKMAAQGVELPNNATMDTVKKMINNSKSERDKDLDEGGKAIGEIMYKPLFRMGREDITYTVAIVENAVDQIQKVEGEYSNNYLEALRFMSFAYTQNKKTESASAINDLIKKVNEKILSVNYQRGLAYFPDSDLSKHQYLLVAPAEVPKRLDYWFIQKNIIEKTYGKVHPAYLNVLSGISNDYSSKGFSGVSNYYKAQVDMISGYLGTHYTTPIINETIYSLLMPDLEAHRNKLKYFMLNWSKKNEVGIPHLYNLVLNDKQKLLSKYQKFKQNEFVVANNTTTEIENSLNTLSKQTGVNIDYKSVYGFDKNEHNNLISGVQNFAKNIADLAKDYFNFDGPVEFENGEKVDPEGEKFDWRSVQNKLTKGQVVVEYFYLDKSKIYPDSSVIEYYALILKPNSSQIILKYLFNQNELIPQLNYKNNNELINLAYRGQPKRGIGVNTGSDKNKKSSIIPGKLYDLCWKPIAFVLEPTDTSIYYSPSGLLHNVSFVAINTPQGKLLSDIYKLNYVSSSEKILKPAGNLRINQNTSIALFGNPPTNQKNLEEALKEIKTISSILNTKTKRIDFYEGLKASEANFKKVGTNNNPPTIIHIATHGTYNVDSKNLKNSDALSRSYLLMSNEMVDTSNTEKDGKLTALEVSYLNFSETKLVVLSACESGLGGNGGDEGVVGLQRAFKIAGAEYILASLWSVPDEETSELMGYFYDNLNKGKSIPKAFELAQNKMKEKKYDAVSWAAFVLMR